MTARVAWYLEEESKRAREKRREGERGGTLRKRAEPFARRISGKSEMPS
jgi:hypothetical protein